MKQAPLADEGPCGECGSEEEWEEAVDDEVEALGRRPRRIIAIIFCCCGGGGGGGRQGSVIRHR